jgi:hypothetical protein
VKAQLASVEQTNARIRAQRDRAAVAAELADRREEVALHTLKLQDIDRRKADGIAAANLPVPGLGFNADGVTLNGIPFSQASTAEQIRVSTALAMSANPAIRVMRIDGGESLDSTSLDIITDLAAEHRYQVWISARGRVPVGRLHDRGRSGRMSAFFPSTDHAAVARSGIRLALNADQNGHGEVGDRYRAEAQVHATLALVEEQRTANLIALFNEQGPEVFRAVHTGLPETASERAVEASIRSLYLDVADVIRERLGLA